MNDEKISDASAACADCLRLCDAGLCGIRFRGERQAFVSHDKRIYECICRSSGATLFIIFHCNSFNSGGGVKREGSSVDSACRSRCVAVGSVIYSCACLCGNGHRDCLVNGKTTSIRRNVWLCHVTDATEVERDSAIAILCDILYRGVKII